MYLHLGSNISVPTDDIVGIFDLDHASTSAVTRAFLRSAEEEGMVVNVGTELPKSAVICCPAGSWQRVYISPLSAAALARRAAGEAEEAEGPDPAAFGKERLWKR